MTSWKRVAARAMIRAARHGRLHTREITSILSGTDHVIRKRPVSESEMGIRNVAHADLPETQLGAPRAPPGCS